MRTRALALGILAALAWVGAARVSFERGLQPVRPLYDGTTPPPTYRWVEPPPELVSDNVAPTSTTKTFDLTGPKSPSKSVASDDAQASVTFSEGSFEVPPGATGVEVTIAPLDPEPLGNPPRGIVYDGNAYRFEAVYLPSREPLRFVSPCPEVTSCLTIILRYPSGGTKLLRRGDERWQEIAGAQHIPSTFQVYGNADGLGTYVAAGLPSAETRDDSFANLLALGLGVAAVGGAIAISRFSPSRRRAQALQAQRKRQASSRRDTKR